MALYDIYETIEELSRDEKQMIKAECEELASRYLMVCDISAFWRNLSKRLTDTAADDIDFGEYERDYLQIILVICMEHMRKHASDGLFDFWHNLHLNICLHLENW